MVRVAQDDRPGPVCDRTKTLDGFKVTLFDEQEVGKNKHEVGKEFVAYFVDLQQLKDFVCEVEDQEPWDNFWEDGDDHEELNKTFYRRVKQWDGKTRLVLEGREPDNWGGAVRFELKPKQWKATVVWK